MKELLKNILAVARAAGWYKGTPEQQAAYKSVEVALVEKPKVIKTEVKKPTETKPTVKTEAKIPMATKPKATPAPKKVKGKKKGTKK